MQNNQITVNPGQILPNIQKASIPEQILKKISINDLNGQLQLSQSVTHNIGKITTQQQSIYLQSFCQSEQHYCDSIVTLFNAASIRQDYYNSKQLIICLDKIKINTSLSNLSPELVDFVDSIHIENERGAAIKILRNIQPNIIRFITSKLLNYEEIRISQLVDNLETEQLLACFSKNKVIGFSLVALEIANKIAVRMGKMSVLSQSTRQILQEVGLSNVPLDGQYQKQKPLSVQNVFQLLETYSYTFQKAVFSFWQIQAACKWLIHSTNCFGLQSDISRELSLSRILGPGSMEHLYDRLFGQIGLVLSEYSIYTCYDALFYPLIIKLLHYKDNALSINALNVPFSELQRLSSEIRANEDQVLLNCQAYKQKFETITRKSRHSNITLGVSLLKQISVDLSKCFTDFNIDLQSPIMKSEQLMASLASFSTFQLFVALLIRTMLHCGSLMNFSRINTIDLITKQQLSEYYTQMSYIVKIFQKFDAVVKIQQFYKSRKDIDNKPHDTAFYSFQLFKLWITRLQALFRSRKYRTYISVRRNAANVIQRAARAKLFSSQQQMLIEKVRKLGSVAIKIQAFERMKAAKEIKEQQLNAVLKIQNKIISRSIIEIAHIEYYQIKELWAVRIIQRSMSLTHQNQRIIQLAANHYQLLQNRRNDAIRLIKKCLLQYYCQSRLRILLLFAIDQYKKSIQLIQQFYKTGKRKQLLSNSLNEYYQRSKISALVIQKYYRQKKINILSTTQQKQNSKNNFNSTAPPLKKRKTSLRDSIRYSMRAVLEANNPFLQQMNLERIYHAIELNQLLMQLCQTSEFVATLFACCFQFSAQVKRAPKTNYKKHGIVIIGLLNDLYDSSLNKEMAASYPLSVRNLFIEKRLPYCKQAIQGVVDSGTLLCRDMKIGTLSLNFGQLLNKIDQQQSSTQIAQIRKEWKLYCAGLGDGGVQKVKEEFLNAQKHRDVAVEQSSNQ